jgi:hypothetical protein
MLDTTTQETDSLKLSESPLPESIENSEVSPEPELSELDKAIKERMGTFPLSISPADLKYIKNVINNKVEWKGPNEAYLILIALLSISSELKDKNSTSIEKTKVFLPSTTLESINFFLSRVTGKGEESAQRLFSISMILRPALEEIKKLDEIIEKLKSEEK